MLNDIEKICVSEEEINEIVTRLGKQISLDYEGKDPIFIGLLKGCAPFMVDLLKKVTIYCEEEFVKVTSYSGNKSTGNVNIIGNVPVVLNRDVIVVDDILDTGRTLKEVKTMLYSMGAKSVALAVLLDKPEGRIVPIQADYVGGLVPNEFVVGYGLDYNERYRNLPYIGVLKKEVYSK